MNSNLISQGRKLWSLNGGVLNTLRGVQNSSFCQIKSNIERKSISNNQAELSSRRCIDNTNAVLSSRLFVATNTCQITSNTNLTGVRSLHTTSSSNRNENDPEQYKTKIKYMSEEEDAPLLIKAISQIGFRLTNNMVIHGSIVMVQESVLSWNVYDCQNINEASLSLFHMLAPKYELLIIGYGDRENRLDVKFQAFLEKKGVNVEAMATKDAVSMYNQMLYEGRKVVGAFIPPRGLRISGERAMETLLAQGHDPFKAKEEETHI